MADTAATLGAIDEGVAYGRPAGTHDARLTEVGPGTPMGEFMRRYWHPVELSENVGETPLGVRVLGEDLVLFRDGEGRTGLLHHRCMHRGTSLVYGKCESDGIRCCYHGWKFAVDGRCLDQPAEPKRGLAKSNFRQPWYPTRERYGLVWAYLGPPEKKPLLPVIEIFEDLEPGEQLFTDDTNIGAMTRSAGLVPFNWLQHFENLPDMSHFAWLHVLHSGSQFEGGGLNAVFEQPGFETWEFMRDSIAWEPSPMGQATHMTLQMGEHGPKMRFTLEAAMPTWRCVPNPWGMVGPLDHIGFVLPVDDRSFKIFTVLRGKDPVMYRKVHEMVAEKWAAIDADPSFPQRHPDDYEAQSGQGEITLHSEEHLVTGDRGIVMLRKIYQEQLDHVAAGGDPIGVGFEPGSEMVQLVAGLYPVQD